MRYSKATHGPGPHHATGRFRLRHGDVRAAMLLALQRGPAHGYELGQRLERISNGAWRPSPGSIYPTLQALADEDCVSFQERDGKRVYALARKGLSELKAREARGSAAPWLASATGHTAALREAAVALTLAIRQIAAAGSTDQQARAVDIVTDARRRLYELLVQG